MTASARRFDADVHVAVPSAKALYPYLSAYWQETLTHMHFRQPPSVAHDYPPWSEPLATRGAEITLERVRADVLDGAEGALLHCYHGVESIQHPFLAPALARAVNEWLAREWLDRDERLLASAVIAPQYPQSAVEEVERIGADQRFVQLLLPVRSLLAYGHQVYWPIWEAAEAHGLALALVYGGGSGAAPTPVNYLASFLEEYGSATLNHHAQVCNLVFSGVFDRFPALKVVLAESGWTWLPSLMWRMDKEWKSAQREVPWIDGPPSGYVRRHFRATTQPADSPPRPEQLREVLDELGSDELLMYASDYPHRYSTGADELLAVLSSGEAGRMLWANAAECYGLPRARPAGAATAARSSEPRADDRS